MKVKRKVCIVTGTRAEYGLLFWLMKEIKNDPELELMIIATGSHLSPEFGLTYRNIEDDGFYIDAKVEMLLSSDTPVGIAKSMGLATICFADVFDRIKPDILVVLGDRYEILAAVQTALVARIPVAHIHGGEITEGLMDEAIRHSITKMSQLHFVAAEPYKNRVIQMGESPERVFNFGAPALDSIKKLKLLSRIELQNELSLKLGAINFLVTYHPVTLASCSPQEAMNELFKAFDEFDAAKIIFTKPNSDTNGRIISQMIDEYVAQHPDRAVSFTSLGQLRYLSVVQHADIVIGNSSSGLIEVPFFRKPTINLGMRQRGRLKADSVIDCEETKEEIILAIQKALSPGFQKKLEHCSPLYGDGNTSYMIKEVLKTASLDNIVIKKFYDVVI